MWKVQVVHNLLRESVIFPSVSPCVSVYTRGSRRGATNWGVCSADVAAASRWAESTLSCCGNVWTEDAGVLVQSKLETVALHPSWAVLTEVPVNCGCPWPIQACFSLTRWVIVGFILPVSEYAACCEHHRIFRYDEAEESGGFAGTFIAPLGVFHSLLCKFRHPSTWKRVISRTANAFFFVFLFYPFAELEQQMTAPPNTGTSTIFGY